MIGMVRRGLSQVRREEGGAILVLTAFVILLVFVLAAIAVDLSFMSQRRQNLWNSADAAALAGASQLPDSATDAETLARQYAIANDADLGTGLDVTFRCVVGDRDNDGQPDLSDIPYACDPGISVPRFAPPFVCDNGICVAPCDPADVTAKCNTIVLEADKEVPYNFAPVIGIDEGNTTVKSAACRGSCGGIAIAPVDLILVLDRTGSMGAELANAKNAALAVLDLYDPSVQHVGLALLGATHGSDNCTTQLPQSGGKWLTVGLSSDYKVDLDGDGDLEINPASEIVQVINCITHSGQGTNLGSPIKDQAFSRPDSLTELQVNGRAGVRKGIILLSDGQANEPGGGNTPDPPGYNNLECQYAVDMAAAAKAAAVEIYTIGFGVSGKFCADGSGSYTSTSVGQLLADMASGPTDDDCDDPAVENSDGDHLFCQPASGDLSDVFVAAATSFAAGSQLVYLPPGA